MTLDFHFGARPGSEQTTRLGHILARHLALADVLGRLQIVRHAHKLTGKSLPLAETSAAVRFAEDDQKDGTLGLAFDLPDDRSARMIQQLTPVTRAVFDGLVAQYRRDAFTLAGVADVRLIEKIRNALAEVARTGQTADVWKREVNKLTTQEGVAQLNSFTLDTAFNTAMQKAYSAGRLEQMSAPHMIEALPFWQYWTVGDDRVRPEHAAIHKFIARAIDPVWRKIYPPSGFNCRCSVAPITEDEALKADPHASEGGLERLMARMGPLFDLVPTPGFFSLTAPLRAG